MQGGHRPGFGVLAISPVCRSYRARVSLPRGPGHSQGRIHSHSPEAALDGLKSSCSMYSAFTWRRQVLVRKRGRRRGAPGVSGLGRPEIESGLVPRSDPQASVVSLSSKLDRNADGQALPRPAGQAEKVSSILQSVHVPLPRTCELRLWIEFKGLIG